MISEFKRSQMEVRLAFIRDDIELSATEIEGGVLDVVSFVLRLVCVSLNGGRRLLILDEPFKFVDEINRQHLPKILDVLAESMDFRLIIVTHLPELMDEATVMI
jgi:DNA repair exonuclease SbcCD ATPase subunit